MKMPNKAFAVDFERARNKNRAAHEQNCPRPFKATETRSLCVGETMRIEMQKINAVEDEYLAGVISAIVEDGKIYPNTQHRQKFFQIGSGNNFWLNVFPDKIVLESRYWNQAAMDAIKTILFNRHLIREDA